MAWQPARDPATGGGAEGPVEPPPVQPRRLTRRRLLIGLGAAGAGGAIWAVSGSEEDTITPAGAGEEPAPLPEAGSGQVHDLADFADNVQSGGPPPDGIPSIDAPVYVGADDAVFLDDEDVVFGLFVDGRPRAYPQLVLVWHEIVNESSEDGPMSVTYCPLTGSAVGFRPPNGVQEFGTSGNLVNSNLLMYDRTDESTWPQIPGQAITGPRRGEVLEEFPVEWTTWQRWRDAFPETEVLSAETGFVRRYGDDPYGSYNPLSGYYREGAGRLFPVMVDDDRFDAKSVFIGAKLGHARLAVHKDRALTDEMVAAEMDGTPVAFLHDPALATARVFRLDVDGDTVDLEPTDQPGEYSDRRSGAVWDSWGAPVRGTGGSPLQRVLSYDVMWFAWVAFFPDTDLIG